jgi:hypothetical protein
LLKNIVEWLMVTSVKSVVHTSIKTKTWRYFVFAPGIGMLRRSSRLLMGAFKNTVTTSNGCGAKLLSTDTFVVKHDDVNQMFYIQLGTGMEVLSFNLYHN